MRNLIYDFLETDVLCAAKVGINMSACKVLAW
jgi:hypothetical protein